MYIMGVTTCIFLGTVNWLPFRMCIGYSNTVFLSVRLLMSSLTFFRFLCLFPSWFRGGMWKLLAVAYVATSLPDGTAVLPTPVFTLDAERFGNIMSLIYQHLSNS